MVRFKHKGDFSKTTRYLMRLKESARIKILHKYGQKGVAALASATPFDTGQTANSWSYNIVSKQGLAAIEFHNSNIQNGVPIAIILQYGHGTGTGGWVEGRDYINPTIQPLFEEISQEAWREVTSL
jgi:hypothetical protein